MGVKILGGLAADNFASESSDNRRRIEIQQVLFDQNYIAGIQLRVGHEHTNGLPVESLLQKIYSLGLPYIIHGPAENLGVDLGECFDECNKFGAYKLERSDIDWKTFNQQAVSNASRVARGENCLDQRIVLHPGYAPYDKCVFSRYLAQIKNFLINSLEDIPITLETVPSLNVESNGEITYYGFGGVSEEMKGLLGEDADRDGSVLIDFTHVGVTANQMIELSDEFSNTRTYEQLVKNYLDLGVSKFIHFSGHTNELWDVHAGFITPSAQDNYKMEVVKDALEELSRRHGDIYVALELNFNDLNKSKKEIEKFCQDYL